MTLHTKNFLLLLFFAVLTYFVGREMKKLISSKEVVAFEFIGTETKAKALLNSIEWRKTTPDSDSKIDKLRINTRIDFLYIVCYVSLFIFLARVLLGNDPQKTKTMTWMLVVVGGADVLENFCLLQTLNGTASIFPMLMFGFAVVKFSLLILFLLWLLISVVQRLLKR